MERLTGGTNPAIPGRRGRSRPAGDGENRPAAAVRGLSATGPLPVAPPRPRRARGVVG